MYRVPPIFFLYTIISNLIITLYPFSTHSIPSGHEEELQSESHALPHPVNARSTTDLAPPRIKILPDELKNDSSGRASPPSVSDTEEYNPQDDSSEAYITASDDDEPHCLPPTMHLPHDFPNWASGSWEGSLFKEFPEFDPQEDRRFAFFEDFMRLFLKREPHTSKTEPWQRTLLRTLISPARTRVDLEKQLLQVIPPYFHNQTFLNEIATTHGIITISFRYTNGPLLQFLGQSYLKNFQKGWVDSTRAHLFEAFCCAFLGHHAGTLVEHNSFCCFRTLERATGFFRNAYNLRTPIQLFLESLWAYAAQREPQPSKGDALSISLVEHTNELIEILNRQGKNLQKLTGSFFEAPPAKRYKKLQAVLSNAIVPIPSLEEITHLLAQLRGELRFTGFRDISVVDEIERLMRREFPNITAYTKALNGIEGCLHSLTEGSHVTPVITSQRASLSTFDSAMDELEHKYDAFKASLEKERLAMEETFENEETWRLALHCLVGDNFFLFPAAMLQALSARAQRETEITRAQIAADDLIAAEKQEEELKRLKKENAALKKKQKREASAKAKASTSSHNTTSAREEKLTQERDEARASFTQQKKEIAELKKALANAKTFQQDLLQRTKELQIKLDQTLSSEEQTTKTTRLLRSSLKVAEKRVSQLETQNIAERERAQQSLAEKTAELEALKQRMDEVIGCNTRLRNQLSETATKAQTEKAEIERGFLKQSKELGERLANYYTRQFQSLTSHNRQLQEQITQLRGRLTGVDVRMSSLIQERDHALTERVIAHSENTRLQQELSRLMESRAAEYPHHQLNQLYLADNRLSHVTATEHMLGSLSSQPNVAATPLRGQDHLMRSKAESTAELHAPSADQLSQPPTDYSLWGTRSKHDQRPFFPAFFPAGAPQSPQHKAAISANAPMADETLPPDPLTQLKAAPMSSPPGHQQKSP